MSVAAVFSNSMSGFDVVSMRIRVGRYSSSPSRGSMTARWMWKIDFRECMREWAPWQESAEGLIPGRHLIGCPNVPPVILFLPKVASDSKMDRA